MVIGPTAAVKIRAPNASPWTITSIRPTKTQGGTAELFVKNALFTTVEKYITSHK
jgi:hypothetical protein